MNQNKPEIHKNFETWLRRVETLTMILGQEFGLEEAHAACDMRNSLLVPVDQ